MLKFIDENDFNLVDVFQLNENGTVSWKRNHLGVSGSGIIREGLTRTKQIQNGTEMVVFGQVQATNEAGQPLVYFETGEPIMEDITEERPTYETVVINVWDKLWELHNDPDSDVTVLPVDMQRVLSSAKAFIDSERDRLTVSPIDYAGATFQVEKRHRDDMLESLETVKILDDPALTVTWFDINNVGHEFNVQLLSGLFVAYTLRKKDLVYAARAHKNAILAMTSPADVEQYLQNLNWSNES